MICAYCGKEGKGTKEHIVSHSVLGLFPECNLTFDENRSTVYESEPMVKDVCASCNNEKISYIDSYAKTLIAKYFVKSYQEDDKIEFAFDLAMVQKMLLKYAFNDMRSRKADCSFFDDEVKGFLLDPSNTKPLEYVTVLCGLAVNVSPVPLEFFGNLKIRWSGTPLFFTDSNIAYIDFDTGKYGINYNNGLLSLDGLAFSYVFRFNSGQFILLCWDKTSEREVDYGRLLEIKYPYTTLRENQTNVNLSLCTNEINFHQFNLIHIRNDGLFTIGKMRKRAGLRTPTHIAIENNT